MKKRSLRLFKSVPRKVSEADAHEIIFGITLVVDYLHSNFIAHRDIKPENTLLIQERNDSRVLNNKNRRICVQKTLFPALQHCQTYVVVMDSWHQR